MAIIKRKAEAENDEKATVGDLIQQMQNWDQNKTASSAEEKILTNGITLFGRFSRIRLVSNIISD